MRFTKPKNNQNLIAKTIVFGLILAQVVVPVAALAQYSVTDPELANLSKSDADYAALTLGRGSDGKLLSTYLDGQDDTEKPDRVVRAVMTAYTSTIDQCDDDPFIAAWGERVFDGMIAANWLPHNTLIKIPSLFGDKVFRVADRMNARYGFGRIDIWMPGPRVDAIKFGVKRADIEIYYPETKVAIAK
ncbi:MAG: hypothetical protein A2261_04100 [Candidatus Magasanikbacteria bacterium RIFOXYA2_FULL_44_8]|uniref:3D domain-containing protein n=1 Tax=Candidatus Magasanikbacteria bacterium RIFOXYA2_FULL_44_8 TaxID=1798696 RepID=A0A1F6NJ24_9BACT|nr:MAG: hypothetical protein A2261_04100 [Candidatus Magasanikbacteria bacterium RIFOXYA2_FULL_44_8]